MEKFVEQGLTNVGPGTHRIFAFQLDQGEVEAQVKRIMVSFGAEGLTKLGAYKLGLFQFEPTTDAHFAEDEAIVLSGATGNQFAHNDTITMRVPKDWYIGLQITNFDGAQTLNTTYNLQLNYKVLN